MPDATPPEDPALPGLGSSVNVPVFQAPTRLTLFADVCVVATSAPSVVELVFLRQELLPTASSGVVVASTDSEADLQMQGMQFQQVTMDVGHVRMGTEGAVNAAISLLQHVINYHGADRTELMSRLREHLGGAT